MTKRHGYSRFLILLMLVWTAMTAACHKVGVSDNSDGDRVAQDAQADEPTHAAIPTHADEPTQAAAVPDGADEKNKRISVYPDFGWLPAPEDLTDSHNAVYGRVITTSAEEKAACVALLLKDGFRQTGEPETYIKDSDSSLMIVQFSEGEGELVIRMYPTHDPMGRYAKLSESHIPYPYGRDECAAEYADVRQDGETLTYIYYNQEPAFAEAYENRLIDAGFEKSAGHEKSVYQKTAETKRLTVEIEKTNARGTDVQIHIRVSGQ